MTASELAQFLKKSRTPSASTAQVCSRCSQVVRRLRNISAGRHANIRAVLVPNGRIGTGKSRKHWGGEGRSKGQEGIEEVFLKRQQEHKRWRQRMFPSTSNRARPDCRRRSRRRRGASVMRRSASAMRRCAWPCAQLRPSPQLRKEEDAATRATLAVAQARRQRAETEAARLGVQTQCVPILPRMARICP